MRYISSIPVLLVAALAAACSNDPAAPAGQIEYGSAVNVGNGQARSYIVSADGKPTEIGIALSETALDGLPPGQTEMDSHAYLLPLPSDNATGYQVVELDWNPAGHPPPQVYTVPHFDFHFYTASLADRNSIVPTDPDFVAKADSNPPARYRPTGYVSPLVNGHAQAVPMMGVHWLNTAAPEFNGSPFTATFIYGAWDGHFTFVEPMVSLAYLQTHPDTEPSVVMPSAFETDGYRPQAYRVKYDPDAREFRVGITQLKFIKGS